MRYPQAASGAARASSMLLDHESDAFRPGSGSVRLASLPIESRTVAPHLPSDSAPLPV